MKRSTIKNKLDALCGEIVRARGRCERCGRTETLQCCHIYSRTYLHLRWFIPNLLCWCASCHFWGHKNPVEFTEWVKANRAEHLGELKRRRNLTDKIYDHELMELYEKLKEAV